MATRSLLQQLSPSLLAAVRRILGPRHPALEDVLQESLVAFMKALPQFRGESNPRTYASSIAVRTALAHRRQASERRRWDAQHALQDRPLLAQPGSPEADVQRERRRSVLRALLAELPLVQAETFALRIVLQYSLEEVAEATSAPVNTVRSRLRLAREALRARIDGDPQLAGLFEDSP